MVTAPVDMRIATGAKGRQRSREKHRASMLQDVLAERQTEVDFMNGAIVQWGEKVSVPTPLNKALWKLIKGLEHSWKDPD